MLRAPFLSPRPRLDWLSAHKAPGGSGQPNQPVERESLATLQEQRERRAGQNQSLFRDVNERIRQGKEGRTAWMGISQWVCECADEDCTERIRMSLDEYEELRENPTHFAVAPDMKHVVPDAELVVEKHEYYWVVEKVREAAEVAEQRDVR
jgi:hypothetical protein